MTTFGPTFDIQEDTLKEWNKQHPVTEIEAQDNAVQLYNTNETHLSITQNLLKDYSIANPTDRPQIATYFFHLLI